MDDENTYIAIKNTSTLDESGVIALLKTIYDPEIPYSIYDIGLIYGITLTPESIEILMTLTTANCPEAISLPMTVEEILQEAYPAYQIKVVVTFEPAWSVDNMTDEIKLGLGLL